MMDLCYPVRMEYRLRAIGIVHSCFKEKFGIPRQAGLVPAARGTLELFEPFNRREYLEGLEGFSHIWLQYVLHAAEMASRRSKVRPPRLGGNQRVGVFGTRSNFRPNPIGLSLVTLEGITLGGGGARLRLKGIDLLDQTPVLDIKPYVPYADSCPEAVGGFAGERPEAVLAVRFANPVRAALRGMRASEKRQLTRLLVQVLRLDPRPAYYAARDRKKDFGMHLLDWNVRWRVAGRTVTVVDLIHQPG
jgi:tRNA-Thr(GGU) m(6)t(6)A37 methyltransferase TsaA